MTTESGLACGGSPRFSLVIGKFGLFISGKLSVIIAEWKTNYYYLINMY